PLQDQAGQADAAAEFEDALAGDVEAVHRLREHAAGRPQLPEQAPLRRRDAGPLAMAVGIGELLGVAEQAQPIAVATDGLLDFTDLVTRHARSRYGAVMLRERARHGRFSPCSPIAHGPLMRPAAGAGKLQPSFNREAAMAGNRLRIAIWGLAAALWLLPLVAMQFTDEVNWTAFDFVFWAGMLLVACTAYEVVSRMSPSRAYRAGVGVAVVTGFLVIWINGAVGMIGDEDNAWNLLFLVALVVGAAGALLSWFRPA